MEYYPLVNQHKYRTSPFFMENPLFLWPFSIANRLFTSGYLCSKSIPWWEVEETTPIHPRHSKHTLTTTILDMFNISSNIPTWNTFILEKHKPWQKHMGTSWKKKQSQGIAQAARLGFLAKGAPRFGKDHDGLQGHHLLEGIWWMLNTSQGQGLCSLWTSLWTSRTYWAKIGWKDHVYTWVCLKIGYIPNYSQKNRDNDH